MIWGAHPYFWKHPHVLPFFGMVQFHLRELRPPTTNRALHLWMTHAERRKREGLMSHPLLNLARKAGIYTTRIWNVWVMQLRWSMFCLDIFTDTKYTIHTYNYIIQYYIYIFYTSFLRLYPCRKSLKAERMIDFERHLHPFLFSPQGTDRTRLQQHPTSVWHLGLFIFGPRNRQNSYICSIYRHQLPTSGTRTPTSTSRRKDNSWEPWRKQQIAYGILGESLRCRWFKLKNVYIMYICVYI